MANTVETTEVTEVSEAQIAVHWKEELLPESACEKAEGLDRLAMFTMSI
jgi:hypothetical protein